MIGKAGSEIGVEISDGRQGMKNAIRQEDDECWCVVLIAGVAVVSDSTEDERVIARGWGAGWVQVGRWWAFLLPSP